MDKKMRECIISNHECMGPVDLDHCSTVGSGAGDTIIYDGEELNNLCPLCRKHHTIKHAKGFSHMIKMYPRYLMWLMKERRVDIIYRAMRA